VGFFSKLFGKQPSEGDSAPSQGSVETVQSPSAADPPDQEHPDAPAPQAPPTPQVAVPITEVRTPPNWRESEGHQLILLYFTGPNATGTLPRSYDWAGVLGESVESAVSRLIADGALWEVIEAKWRILYGRGATELKELCRSHGLKVSGTKEQLAERLAGIDPTGSAFGHGGRLYICSEEAARLIALHRHSLEVAMGDLRRLGGLFSFAEFGAEKGVLAQRFSNKGLNAPSNDDVKWSLLNKRALQHATEGNLGLCRNCYLAMAEFLQRRDKLKQALTLYLLVCAYDLNGAENRGGWSGELLKEFPLFDLKMSSLAPAVIDEVQDIMEAIPLTLDEVSVIFTDTTARTNFPLPTERSWSVLALALEGKIDLNEQPECFKRIRRLIGKAGDDEENSS